MTKQAKIQKISNLNASFKFRLAAISACNTDKGQVWRKGSNWLNNGPRPIKSLPTVFLLARLGV